MKSAAAILAGLLTGIIVAAGVLAAFVFVGPDPVGLQPTPSPSSSVLASPSAGGAAPSSASPSSASPSSASPASGSAPASLGPSGSPDAAPSADASGGAIGFHLDEPAFVLVLGRFAGGPIDAANKAGSMPRRGDAAP